MSKVGDWFEIISNVELKKYMEQNMVSCAIIPLFLLNNCATAADASGTLVGTTAFASVPHVASEADPVARVLPQRQTQWLACCLRG